MDCELGKWIVHHPTSGSEGGVEHDSYYASHSKVVLLQGGMMDFIVDFTEECLRLYYLLDSDASLESIRAWFTMKEQHPDPAVRDFNQYLTWRHPQSSVTPFTLVVTKDRIDVMRLIHQMGVDLDNKKLVGRFVGSPAILAASSYKSNILQYLLVDCSLGCRHLPEVTSLFS
ncbi:hypothetical protein EON65_58430, partial [archaeon]